MGRRPHSQGSKEVNLSTYSRIRDNSSDESHIAYHIHIRRLLELPSQKPEIYRISESILPQSLNRSCQQARSVQESVAVSGTYPSRPIPLYPNSGVRRGPHTAGFAAKDLGLSTSSNKGTARVCVMSMIFVYLLSGYGFLSHDGYSRRCSRTYKVVSWVIMCKAKHRVAA